MMVNDIQEMRPGYTPKQALTEKNLANHLEDYLNRLLPQLSLVSPKGAWFTGSRIWHQVYDMTPNEDSDLDVIVENDQTGHALIKLLDLAPTGRTTQGGDKYIAPNGLRVDIWKPGPVMEALQGYPAGSHGHARVAFNLATKTVVMVANSEAK